MMVVYVDAISISMGAGAGDKEDITNIEKFMWRETPQPNLRAITVMNTVSPVAFKQGHKWIEGELHVKSEAQEAIHNNGSGPVDYLPAGADAVAVPYFVATITGHDTSDNVYTFTGLKVYSEELSLAHEGEGITIYKFLATSVAKT